MTAIVAGNDLMALGCYDAFVARGVACPAQISVVGFNDMPFAGLVRPAADHDPDPALRDRLRAPRSCCSSGSATRRPSPPR